MQPTAVVHGDIATKKLIVQEGGEVNGRVNMGEPKALEQGAAIGAQSEAPKQPAVIR